MLVITILIFCCRNINRISNEINIYNYDFITAPHYRINSDFYKLQMQKKEIFTNSKNCTQKGWTKYEKNRNCKFIGGYTFFY